MKIIGFIKVSEFSKKKDFILMNPFLTYFGESLFFFFDLICRNFYYSEDDDNKTSKKDYLFFGLISLLLLIIDIYRYFILICFKIISYRSYIMILNSWALLLLFSILISYLFFKIRVYKHHKLVIYICILFEIYFFSIVIFTGEKYEFILLFTQSGISLIESITIILIKNIMDKKFFSPFKVCYLIGFFNFIMSFIILFILSKVKCNNDLELCNKDENIFNFSSIYNTNINFSYIFIYLFFTSLFNGINKYLINAVLKKYTIFHVSLFYQYNSLEFIFLIATKLSIINDNETISKITNIIHNIFNIFGMLLHFIFLEKIELNFCNLSENIKRNIQDRADDEFNDLTIDNKELKIKLDLDDVASSNYKENIDSEINEKEINQ
jgi:hypothetical protein